MRERHEWKLNEVDPSDRDAWRSNVRSAMSAMEGSPLMWMILQHLHVDLNADDDGDEPLCQEYISLKVCIRFALPRRFQLLPCDFI